MWTVEAVAMRLLVCETENGKPDVLCRLRVQANDIEQLAAFHT